MSGGCKVEKDEYLQKRINYFLKEQSSNQSLIKSVSSSGKGDMDEIKTLMQSMYVEMRQLREAMHERDERWEQ